jgi:hypothetical protein
MNGRASQRVVKNPGDGGTGRGAEEAMQAVEEEATSSGLIPKGEFASNEIYQT